MSKNIAKINISELLRHYHQKAVRVTKMADGVDGHIVYKQYEHVITQTAGLQSRWIIKCIPTKNILRVAEIVAHRGGVTDEVMERRFASYKTLPDLAKVLAKYEYFIKKQTPAGVER